MKKKLTLLPIVLASIVFGQTKPKMAKVPVFPGCEQYNKNQDLVSCFSSGAKGFTKTYFLLYKNLLDYFQFPSIEANTIGSSVSFFFMFICNNLYKKKGI